MFYRIVQIFIRLALKFYCRKVIFSDDKVLHAHGPLLLACNHPNSFLDAIIIGSHFKNPVHFLARGDAFKKPLARKILSSLNVIPIYRLTEGREYLALNDATFIACRNILVNGGIILIFSEGLCENKWKLRPLKKGSARIALDAWEQIAIEDKFKVLPVGINYNSFRGLNKRIIVHFSQAIGKSQVLQVGSDGEKIIDFNNKLTQRLTEGMLQSTSSPKPVQALLSNHGGQQANIQTLKQKLQLIEGNKFVETAISKLKEPYNIAVSGEALWIKSAYVVCLFPVALIGLVMHLPLYLPIKTFVRRKTKGTVFYDSILFGLLLIFYPLYWLMINVVSLFLIDVLFMKIVLLSMPFIAWIYLQWKDLFVQVENGWRLNLPERELLKNLLNDNLGSP